MKFIPFVSPNLAIMPGFHFDNQTLSRFVSYCDNRLNSRFYPAGLPSDIFVAKFVQLEKETSNDELVTFSKENQLVLPGAVGLASFVITASKTGIRLPFQNECPIIFTDEKDRLYKKDGSWRVPYMKLEERKVKLHVMKWKSVWYSGAISCFFKRVT